MLIAVFLGFIFALSILVIGKLIKGKYAWLSTLVPLSLCLYFASFIQDIAQGKIIKETFQWIPSFGVNLSFQLDGLSLLFALMITGIGTLVFIYTSVYLKGHEYLDRFYAFLSMFMGAMLGLVLSDNLILMFIFWELTSISSFYLIGFNNASLSSRKSALIALGVTGKGGLLFLGGAVLLGVVANTFQISEMTALADQIALSPSYLLIVILFFGAAFSKSAQFPFHFWLPGAMKAPTPVSTYLHSATMVKAGIFLLLRFTPILGNTEFWNSTLIIVGGITMLYAAIHILFRTDLKSILAYSTISALGILVFLIGLGTQTALLACLVFVIVHALYKASLFLITGIIDHKTGTRDITQLAGLKKVLMPVAIAGFLAALISGGVPPTFGFIGKDLIYEAGLNFHSSIWLVVGVALLTKILLYYAGFLAGVKPFMGQLSVAYENIILPEKRLWIPPLMLVGLGLILGLVPQLVENALIAPSIKVLVNSPETFQLKLWHGFNTALMLSLATIVIGSLLYFLIIPSENKVKFIHNFEVFSPKSIIFKFIDGFIKFSNLWTNFFQNGFLRHYVATIIMFMCIVLGILIFSDFNLSINLSSLSDLTIYEVSIVFMMIAAIFFTVFSNSRLAAVASMGIVGFAFCLFFLFYSAPDLAMTQFSVDTLTVILFVLVLYRLPKYLKYSKNMQRLEHGILSVIFGSLMSILVLQVLQEPINTDIADYYAKNAYILAKGKNVVNVILVDFRGIDTLVETCVLIVAALGVFGLLKLHIKTRDKK